MDALSTADILRAWETGVGQHPLDRALTLLRLAGDRRSDLASLPLGERDRRLWKLREATFGSKVEALTQCPGCGERIEFQFLVADVSAPRIGVAGPEHELQEGEWFIRFRLPASSDLAAIATEQDPAAAEAALAARCLVRAERNGAEAGLSEIPAPAWQAVQCRMSELDPQAEVGFQLVCPTCGQRWRALFDIGHFFWTEVAALARRLLREVDLLARAYGWSESEILRLGSVRRRAYLELSGA